MWHRWGPGDGGGLSDISTNISKLIQNKIETQTYGNFWQCLAPPMHKQDPTPAYLRLKPPASRCLKLKVFSIRPDETDVAFLTTERKMQSLNEPTLQKCCVVLLSFFLLLSISVCTLYL